MTGTDKESGATLFFADVKKKIHFSHNTKSCVMLVICEFEKDKT